MDATHIIRLAAVLRMPGLSPTTIWRAQQAPTFSQRERPDANNIDWHHAVVGAPIDGRLRAECRLGEREGESSRSGAHREQPRFRWFDGLRFRPRARYWREMAPLGVERRGRLQPMAHNGSERAGQMATDEARPDEHMDADGAPRP